MKYNRLTTRLLNRLFFYLQGESPENIRQNLLNQTSALQTLQSAVLANPVLNSVARVQHWTHLPKSSISHTDTSDLGALFQQHGSDKSSLHNYHLLYGWILKDRRVHPIKLLEIGLGTNNPNIPSNMGQSGRPGASLRAFRDWAPAASVFGADIDRDILFEESRIRTTFVDQTDPETLHALKTAFGCNFDLIIDDGYHRPVAGFPTVLTCKDMLSNSGTIIVEDIDDSDIPLWQLFAIAMKDELNTQLWKMKTQNACVIRKANS